MLKKWALYVSAGIVAVVALVVTIEIILQTISTYSFTALLGIIGRWFAFTSEFSKAT